MTEQQVLGAALATKAGIGLIDLAPGYSKWYQRLLLGQRTGAFSADVITSSGKLTTFAKNGNGTSTRVNINGIMDFVITQDGALRVGDGHHFTSGQAKSVMAAGQIRVKDGVLKQISNQSGHYRPSEALLPKFKDYFRQLGADVSQAKTTTDDLTRQ